MIRKKLIGSYAELAKRQKLLPLNICWTEEKGVFRYKTDIRNKQVKSGHDCYENFSEVVRAA